MQTPKNKEKHMKHLSIKGPLACALCCFLLVLVGCGDNNDTANNATAANNTSPDTSSPNNTTAPQQDPAYLFVNRVRTPASRTNYVSILPSLDAQTVDLDEALEITGPSRFRVYDGDVFIFEGETGEVARYDVGEDRSLTEVGRFSMAGLGIQGFIRTSIAFISDDRAYYVDPVQAQVVVWSPERMEITTTFDIPEIERDDFPLVTVGTSEVVAGEYVVTPMSWRTQTQSDAVYETVLLVLSATEDEFFALATDDRCGVSSSGVVYEDAYYALGDYDAGAYSVLQPDENLPEPCMLRWAAGADDFDPNYELELTDVVGAPQFSGAFGAVEGKFVVRAYDADFAPSEIPDMLGGNPSAYFGLELWRWAVVDLEDETATLLDDLPLTGVGFNPSVVEGAFYVPQIDEETQASTLFAVDTESTSVTESVSATGDILTVDRIR